METTHLRDYRKRNLVFFGLFIGYMPGLALIGGALNRFFGVQKWLGWVGLVWAVTWMIAGAWRMDWDCPRCHKKFYRKWWMGNAFALSCVHCRFRPGN